MSWSALRQRPPIGAGAMRLFRSVRPSRAAAAPRGAPDADCSALHTVPIEDFLPVTGRHRAAASAVSRAARMMGAGAAVVLVTAVLGWVMAGALGLTGPATTSGAIAALPSAPVQADGAGPTSRRIVDISGAPARPAEGSPAAVETPEPDPPPVAPSAPAPAPAPAPRPTLEPASDPVPGVRPGDACRAEGATGLTKSGKATVCAATPGNGETRWQRA